MLNSKLPRIRLGLVLFLALALSATHAQDQASQRFFLPLLQADQGADLGIALSNPTLENATVDLLARGFDGKRIEGSDITNPATITLPAQGQRALRAAEIFGPGIAGRSGWVEITPSTAAIKGFFIVFDGGLTYIDGSALVDVPSNRLVFPKVASATSISFFNTSSQELTFASMSLFDNNGRLAGNKLLRLAAYSGFSGSLSDLMPDMAAFTGYAVLESAAAPFTGSPEVLVGFESYKNRADVAVLTAATSAAVLRTGYLPHFVSQGGYYSAVGLVNSTNQAQRVRITAGGLEVSGNARPPAVVERTIPANGRLDERADQLFDLSGEAAITGYIRYEVQDNGSGLIGYVEYGTSDGLLLSGVPAQGTGLSDIFFSQIAQGGGLYTGLALLNPNAQPSSVTINAYDRDGNRRGSTAVRLEAGARRTRVLNEFFPALTNLSGGYLHVSASRPIYAFELFGSSSPTILANVPAQGVQLRPQASGRPVSVSKGANVLSNDGSISVAISPGALSSDTAVKIESIRLSDLPNPTSDQRVIAAVDAQPAGTRFKIPVKLTFPLAAQLPADTVLPLLLYNSQTKRYESAESSAIVDDSGRTASAEVTHFSTYVAALTDEQLLNVTSISPAAGVAGAAVSIHGSGFLAKADDNVVTFAGADNASLRATVTGATADALSVVVPARAVTGYVTVRAGTRTSVGVVFTVPEDQPKPSIISLTPSTVVAGASTVDIEISGTGFRPNSTVTYDGTGVTPTFVDSTLLLISLETAQLNPAIHSIVVTNPPPGGGASNAMELTVANPTPVLTAISPSVIDEGDVAEVTITGSGFTDQSTAIVDRSALKPTFVNPTILKIVLPPLEPGKHSITVTNPSPGGGLSRAASLLVNSLVRVGGIFLIDPASGSAGREVVVNEGNTVKPRVLVVDTTGASTDQFPPTFTSLDTSVATVDAQGNIQGKSAGFSTLIVGAGTAVGVFTITVVTVDSGPAGYGATGVAQDFAGRLYLAATQDHTILRAEDVKESPEIYAGKRQEPGAEDGPRFDSRFRKPSFIAFNQGSGGRLFVADGANNKIRRVSPGLAGAVETLAGTGTPGSVDGPATGATFNNPQGVALDNSGHLWIADSGNNTIRRLEVSSVSSGNVETIAGQAGSPGLIDGPGSAARFNAPMGLALETETAVQLQIRQRANLPPPPVHMIVADTGNGAIRRISENGDVETIQVLTSPITAQEGKQFLSRKGLRVSSLSSALTSAVFNSPTGVAVDPLGNIFVTEANTGAVKTILSTGDVVPAVQPNTFRNPQGIAITQTGRVVVVEGNRPAQEIRFGAPQIATVTPTRISNRGGELITITGSNFAPDTAVIIGGAIAPGVRIENTQRITFVAPVAPSGRTTLSVQNRGGIAQTSLIVDPAPAAALARGYITTIAGGSTFAGDGSLARLASIAPPWGVAVDTVGNVFVAETALHRVRRIQGSTNIINTVAGSGQSGFDGDGRLALGAALNNPVGIAVDPAGNLFISDTSNDRIRKVDGATGLISTLAGNGLKGFAGDNGPAAEASLFDPFGIAVDAAGNVYIADTANSRIRKVAAGTRKITTVAGNGQKRFSGDDGLATSASLNFPQGVAVDGDGNIYIADTFNFRIRKVSATTGLITTIAGNGQRGFSGDNGQAVSASIDYAYGLNVDSVGNIFIVDTFNERIRRVDAITGVITTVAGNGQRGFLGDGGPATSAALMDPVAVSIDAAGHLYIDDTFNFRVRKVDARTGIITTVAGSGSQAVPGDNGPATLASLTLPSDVALDRSNNIFIADTFNQQIRRVDASTGTINVFAGNGQKGFSGDNGLASAASLNDPLGVAVDSDGNLLIADTDNNRIRKVSVATGLIVTIAGNGQAAFSGDNGSAVLAALQSPAGLTLDNAGNIYFADTLNDRIRKISAGTGIITTVAGNGGRGFSGDNVPATSASLAKPSSVVVDAAGNLYIADTANYRIRKVAADTGIITTVAGTGARGFTGDNGPATSATLSEPYDVALDRSGNLLIADSSNHLIRRVNLSTRVITTIAGTGVAGFSGDNGPATSARLNNPRAVAVDSFGNIVIADWFNGRIRFVREP